MKETKVFRAKLLEVVEENYYKHAQEYSEAMEGYEEEIRTQLRAYKAQLGVFDMDIHKAIESKEPMDVVDLQQKLHKVRFPHLAKPESHAKDYEKVIRKLQLSNEETITLDETEFTQFVMDEWSWKEQFLASTTLYNSKKA